jgi:hypothetical protein
MPLLKQICERTGSRSSKRKQTLQDRQQHTSILKKRKREREREIHVMCQNLWRERGRDGERELVLCQRLDASRVESLTDSISKKT